MRVPSVQTICMRARKGGTKRFCCKNIYSTVRRLFLRLSVRKKNRHNSDAAARIFSFN